jgi:glutathione S-transferase
MKLRHSPTSPFVRKVMVAAYELGLEDKIERIPTRVAPTQRNDDVVRDNPLVKIPALGDGILDAGILARYEQLRPREFHWQEWIDAQMRKVRGALSALEMECESGDLALLAENAPAPIGQIAIGCALGWLDFRYPNEVWRERHRRLAAWYDGFAQRRSMQETAPKET